MRLGVASMLNSAKIQQQHLAPLAYADEHSQGGTKTESMTKPSQGKSDEGKNVQKQHAITAQQRLNARMQKCCLFFANMIDLQTLEAGVLWGGGLCRGLGFGASRLGRAICNHNSLFEVEKERRSCNQRYT